MTSRFVSILLGCLALGCGGLWCAGLAAAEPATQPDEGARKTPTTQASPVWAEIVQLQITKPLAPEIGRLSAAQRFGSSGSSGSSNSSNGSINLLLVLHVPDRTVIAAGEDALQVQTFIDEKYTDLGRGRRDRAGYSYSSSYNSSGYNITADGHQVVLPISSDRAPSAEATRIFLRGTATVRTSSGEKTSPRQTVALRIGQRIEVGPVPMVLRTLSDGTGSLQATFQTERPTETIKQLRFFQPDGTEIPGRSPGNVTRYSSGSEMRRGPSSFSQTLPANLEKVLVEVEYVEKIETVTVPIELQADIGIASVGQVSVEEVKADEVKPPAPSARPPARPSSRLRTFPASRPSTSASSGGGAGAIVTPPATQPAFPWPPPPEIQTFPSTRSAVAWPAAPAVEFPPAATQGVRRFPATGPATLPGATADVVSLTVNQLPPAPLRDQWRTRPELMFRPQGGTLVRLLVSVPDQTILAVDPASLRITRFADDKRIEHSTALRGGDDLRYGAPSVRYLPVSQDGHQALIQLALDDAPTQGATRILLQGAMTVRMAGEALTAEQKDASITAGSAIKAGPISWTIRSLSSGEEYPRVEGGSSITLHCQINTPPDLIRKVQFFDADGKEIPSSMQIPPVGIPRMDAETAYTISFTLAKDARRATVKVTYFDRAQMATIPIDVMTGIGL